MKQIIEQAKGKFFVAKFVKKNGEIRKMNGRLGVKKYLKGGESTSKDKENLVVVYDVQKKGYRTINLDTMFYFKCGNTLFTR
jgi:hypothetical protein